jgi:hypothetical protein
MIISEFYRNYKKVSEKELIKYLTENPKTDRDLNPAIFRHGTGPEDGLFTHCEIQSINGLLKVGSPRGRLHFDHQYGFWVRKDYLSYKEALKLKPNQ